ncbi:MAG: hypothetical protein INQ03_24690 [Candidatus Heimdallarchaeota archaeon]|nr:hypothetical protein [Candidatus Heimdallarchaeota archaeon]
MATNYTKQGYDAIVYMGTLCNPNTTRPLIILLKELGFTPKQLCWTTSNELLQQVNYFNKKNWAKVDGRYKVAIGHSAGALPLIDVKAEIKIAINPPYPIATFKIFRASNDWLNNPNSSIFKGLVDQVETVTIYLGEHGTMPIKELQHYIRDRIKHKYTI